MGRPKPQEKMVSRIPLVPVRVVWHCPRCEDGKMVAQSGITNNFGTTWHHECDTCGYEASDPEQHPRVDYEEQELEIDPDNLPY